MALTSFVLGVDQMSQTDIATVCRGHRVWQLSAVARLVARMCRVATGGQSGVVASWARAPVADGGAQPASTQR